MNMIKFAALVSWITARTEGPMEDFEIEIFQRFINNLYTEAVDRSVVPANLVDDLLRVMGQDGKKIEAIKAYRMITNADLRTSKDAVEKYWIDVKQNA